MPIMLQEIPGAPRRASNHDDHAYLAPLFLGPAGENEALIERALVTGLREHSRWRRAFHPHDPPSIGADEQATPQFAAAVERTERALGELSARLRQSVPMFSPRYVGHMASDLLLPGLLAQLLTTLYNPNNVSADAAPVTLDLEVQVGQQLARMCGFNTDPARGPSAYGHLTSGGTVANYEALWLQRAIRFYPLALLKASHGDVKLAALLARYGLAADASAWQAINMMPAVIFELRDALEHSLAARADATSVRTRIMDARVEHLGMAEFLRCHGLATPVVICPRTAHYSWPKAMQLLGLGDAQLWYADVDAQMRLEPASVERLLDRAWQTHLPVLAVVAVLGTTEFGTIDPVHDLVALRDAVAMRGQASAVHVDAAWGGYLATLFRAEDGSAVPREVLRDTFRHFPSPDVYAAFVGLGRADSITVDPHKLGYLPYGGGAFIGADRRMTEFVGQRPVYLYDAANPSNSSDRLGQLGDYILEGSKAGAAAAGVFVSNQVLPLDAKHFGRICGQTIRASEDLFDRLHDLATRLAPQCSVVLPVEPDTNLICIAVNPAGNLSLPRMNRFGRQLFSHFVIDPAKPDLQQPFVGSHTSLLRKNLSLAAARRVAQKLGIDPATFVTAISDPERDTDHVFLLRHTLMNPWLTHASEGHHFIERYCQFLESAIIHSLAVDGRG
ncbi:MAG: pyridoxal-dependent decarboxylase [Dokdonella sp.]